MYYNIRDIHELYDVNGNPLTRPGAAAVSGESGFNLSADLTNKIRLTLLDKTPPELRLYGVVNEEMASYVRQALMFLESKDKPPTLMVRITSPGGNIVAGLEIYSLLSQYEGGVKGIVDGYAYSAAAQLILQGCLVRTAGKYSHLMSHFGHTIILVEEYDFGGGRKMRRILEELKTFNDQAVDIIKTRTGKDDRTIRKFLHRGLFLTPKDYKEFGLIDSYYSMQVKQSVDEEGNILNQSFALTE